MRVAVCMKTVVDSQSRLEIDEAGGLRRNNLRTEVNEYDLYAVEEAIRMAEAHEGRVTAISLGGDDVVQGLRKALAMGAEDALHVNHDAFSLDAASTAAALAAALRSREPHVVLAGVESDDLGGSQIGGLLAAELGYACCSVVVGTDLQPDNDTIRVRRELDGGSTVVVDVRLPAVLTIQSGLNEPRYPSLKGIMAAKRKTLETVTLGEIGLGEGPTRRVEDLGLSIPPPRTLARMIEGEPAAKVDELLRILREEEKVL